MKKKYKITATLALFSPILFILSYIWLDYAPDRIAMWETGDESFHSTDRAIEAAERYFDKTDLKGLTRSEVIEKIGDPKKSNDSVHNRAYYPVSGSVMVYRFDDARDGWQFNVHFDKNGKVFQVEKLAIER